VNSYEATRLAKLVRRPNGEALPSATELVLVAYCEYVGPRNGLTVYPSAARIADDLGGVSERTVQRHRARLREWELIEATPRMRSEGRGRTSDATHLTFLEDQPDWRDRVSQDQPDTFDDQPGNSGRSTPTHWARPSRRHTSGEETREDTRTRRQERRECARFARFFSREQQRQWPTAPSLRLHPSLARAGGARGMYLREAATPSFPWQGGQAPMV
jgi:DNA-binding transcriptional ArsR family regulator